MSDRLWRVTIISEGLVLAPDSCSAGEFAAEIERTEPDRVQIEEFDGIIPRDWHADTLVYHSGAGDIRMRDAIDKHEGKEPA